MSVSYSAIVLDENSRANFILAGVLTCRGKGFLLMSYFVLGAMEMAPAIFKTLFEGVCLTTVILSPGA